MKTLTVVPAYGRDYTSKASALADWKDGKDFRIADMSHHDDGRYLSSRDAGALQAGRITHVHIRYRKLTQVCVVAL
jgi:hypothetical protein